jgi:hypothetical protein
MVPVTPATLVRNSPSKHHAHLIKLQVSDAPLSFSGQICGIQVQSSIACGDYLQACSAATIQNPLQLDAPEDSHPVFAELNGHLVELRCAHQNSHTSIYQHQKLRGLVESVTEGFEHAVQNVYLHGPDLNLSAQRDWLFGPLLLLALARLGTFALHASAIRLPDQNQSVLVFGRSGAGKSTFARQFGTRLCDDIAPINAQSMKLKPQFPQLKLENFGNAHVQSEAPIRALICLESERGELQIDRMDAKQLFHALLAHTVAARLFNADDSRAHLQWLSRMSEQFATRAFKLRLPHTPEQPGASAQLALQQILELCE